MLVRPFVSRRKFKFTFTHGKRHHLGHKINHYTSNCNFFRYKVVLRVGIVMRIVTNRQSDVLGLNLYSRGGFSQLFLSGEKYAELCKGRLKYRRQTAEYKTEKKNVYEGRRENGAMKRKGVGCNNDQACFYCCCCCFGCCSSCCSHC